MPYNKNDLRLAETAPAYNKPPDKVRAEWCSEVVEKAKEVRRFINTIKSAERNLTTMRWKLEEEEKILNTAKIMKVEADKNLELALLKGLEGI